MVASEFLMGLWAGWPSWALTKRPMSDTPAEWMTRYDHAWTVAAFDLANVLCAWPAGLLADRIGRRGCLLTMGVLLIGSFAALFAPGPWALFAGRTLGGTAKSLALCTTPPFLAEISTDESRGKVNVIAACFDALGMMVAMIAGPRCPYGIMNGVSLAASVAFLSAVYRVPETPSFLLSRGRPTEARTSHEWYRPGDTAAGHDEFLNRLRTSVHKDMRSPPTFRVLFGSGGNRVALALVLGAVVAQRAGGVTCVLSYSTTTLPGDGPVNPHDVAATFAAVRLAFTMGSVWLIDRYGRRPLLIGSHMACAVVCGAYAYLLYLTAADSAGTGLSFVTDNAEAFGWALGACVVMYVAVYSVGAGAVPGALLGEMFPANIKSRAVTVINITASFSSFAMSAAYLHVTDAVGVHYMYIAFLAVNVTWAACAYLYLFETKGMSLAAIQTKLDEYNRPPSARDVAVAGTSGLRLAAAAGTSSVVP